jgi:hypothetical protein
MKRGSIVWYDLYLHGCILIYGSDMAAALHVMIFYTRNAWYQVALSHNMVWHSMVGMTMVRYSTGNGWSYQHAWYKGILVWYGMV